MRTVADIVHQGQLAIRHDCVEIFAHRDRRDQIIGGLQNKRRSRQARNVFSVIGHEGHPGELLGNFRVGTTEAIGQLFTQCRLPRRAHNGRCHIARPTQVIAVQCVQKRLNVFRREPTDVIVRIDIAGDGPIMTWAAMRPGAIRSASAPIIALTE